jgi:butyrate kinase
MKRIRPITKQEVQEILDRNREVSEFVQKRIGPTTWKELLEEYGMTQSSMNNALSKGGLLSPINRGHVRRSKMSSFEVLKSMTQTLWMKTDEEYGAIVKKASQEISINGDL